MRNGRSKLAVLAAIPLLATACGGGGEAASDGADGGGGGDLSAQLTGAGASFPDPLFQDWIYEYSNGVQPGVSVNYQSVGSGAGVEQFLEQTVDFGSSEEFLGEEDLAAAAEARGCEAVQFPVVFGAVVIALSNPDLDGLVLDAETLAGIYSTEITTFDDPAIAELNPDMDLPSDEIIPVHRADSSGTTYVFSHYLTTEVESWADEYGEGKELDWADGLVGGQQNDGVAQGITQNPGGLGYVNQSFAQEAELAVAHIVNEDGTPIEPTLESTIAATGEAEIPDNFQFSIDNIGGEGYPIAGSNWIFTYTCGYDQANADAIIDFWTWALTDQGAQDLAGELGYAPLNEELTERVITELEKTNSENGGGDADAEATE
ncbi:phosphate ABC transporter substrate-binding protein PstS [Nocardiopsis tropica]|jgi:phosphate transport system substrate-binding protein|uniref:Phosphate-binding protein n=1 Tax=Nocardiopsis tropica TaxID=109330 RepID=A0ABU7KJQ8_9ACTN|nr:phosphate ABC transporter substrate-binding protein PstS [Nocardiopsis umidischolae]MEE2049521.1 phosphate ABC transporter substrate-binding protein PstS [Nocardiopsis umidischolae]